MDYTAESGVLTFNPGDTQETITIPILDTGGVGSDRTVNLALTSVDNSAELGGWSSAVLTIHQGTAGTGAGQLTALAPPTISAVEGEATGPIAVATFTDSNPGIHAGDFSTAIN